MQSQNPQTAPSPVQPQPQATSANLPKAPEDNMAMASLILGVISLCSSVVPPLGLTLAIISLVLGIKGKESVRTPTFAKIGMVLAGISIVSVIIWTIVYVLLPEIVVV